MDRDELFDAVLVEALEEAEVQAGLGQPHAPSVGELGEAARGRKDHLLGQVRDLEEEYRQTVGQARVQRRRARAEGVAFVSGGVVLIVLLVGYSVVTSWSDQLKKAYKATPHHHLGVWAVVWGGLETAVGLVIVGFIIGGIAFAASFLLPSVRSNDPKAEDLQSLVAIAVPTVLIGLAVTFTSGDAASKVVWQLAHRLPAADSVSYGWASLVDAGVGLVCLAAVLSIGWAVRGDMVAVRQAYPQPGGPVEAATKVDAWRSALSGAVLSFLRGEISGRVARHYSTTLELPEDARGLRQVRARTEHVVTPSGDHLAATAAGMDDGSIALSGPRGVGKTDLLNAFCVNPPEGRYGLVLNAPVVFERREFMLHLFDELCGLVIDWEDPRTHAKMAALAQAKACREWIRYLQTRSQELTASAGWKGLGLGGKRGTSMARQPLTYPEIVGRLRDFLQTAAREFRERDARLVIGIDELDRIEPAERARDFLNELKVVFDVPGCLFVLSVSDEALREAGLAQVGHRDVFDSAIDEVIRVEPLTYEYSVRLLDRRAIRLPEPFTALFHCLSGGMPRDLLRTARAAATQAAPGRPRSLSEITAYLVARDLDRGVDNQEPTGPHALFRDTLRQIFTDDLTPGQLHLASDPTFPGSFDALATEQRQLSDPTADRSTLKTIRQSWNLAET
jgi:hypothetical protein